MRTWLLCLLLLSATSALAAPRAVDRTIASSDLLADVDALQQIYETAHPGIYRYLTRPQFLANLSALRQQFSHDRTLGEAYVEIARFLATIRCGHTHANLANQPKGTAEALLAASDRLPFLFRWIDGRMIVTRDLQQTETLPRGTEVLRINGVRVTRILPALLPLVRSDGHNDAKRVALLEVQGNERYETFDVLMPLLFREMSSPFELLVRKPGSRRATRTRVDGITSAQRQTRSGSSEAAEEIPWKLQALDERTAYLRMPTWALYDSKWAWEKTLDTIFDDLAARRVPSLIIDLRGNEGGLDVGDRIVARIATKPVRAAAFGRFTRYRKLDLPPPVSAMLKTWDPSFRDWGASARADRGGYFALTREEEDARHDWIEPRGPRYDGRVVVLIDATNSSATFQFAQMMKNNGLATLVGQPTGGNQRGINGGAYFFVHLPHSQIEVDLPLIGYFPTESSDERPDGARIPFRAIADGGITPDIFVPRTIEDMVRGRDAELERAKALLTTQP